MPIANVESFGVPVIPCGPFTITSPSMDSPRERVSFVEK